MKISRKSFAFILIVSIIIVTFSFKAYSEPKEGYIISDETLLTVKDIIKKFGKVTAVGCNSQLLSEDEIEIDGEKYKLEIDIDSELSKGNEVAIYFKEENNEKFIKYIQIISETIPESPIAVLSSLNILKGDENGNLKLDETITRAEYAVLINRILGVEESAKYAVKDNVFSDVSDKHWACGHINVACDMDIMHGYGDGRFGPEDELAYDQAVTILVRALGYELFAKEKGGFPKGYLAIAKEKGILTNTQKKSKDFLKRSTVFQLIFNSLDIKLLEQTCAKPVIYLYPTSTQKISVKLDFAGELTCTYPEYKNGWNVIAKPDGTLTNLDDNKDYSYLFWEGNTNNIKWDLSKGFVVKGEKTKDFLQDKLDKMGLNPREYNEFIVYWLPLMKDNEYNLIYFAGEEYEDKSKLKIRPKPDSILRVFMVYKKLDKYIEVDKQNIKNFKRKGFTVIEWGGVEIK